MFYLSQLLFADDMALVAKCVGELEWLVRASGVCEIGLFKLVKEGIENS